jgi:predicted transcriptional regulator
MSAKDWSEIDYSKVPSRANLIYNQAFLRNDEARRQQFLDAVKNGEAKINAGTLYPHDIVAKYCTHTRWNESLGHYDEGLESLWKSLPDAVDGCGNTLVVADGSGSMTDCIGKSNISALDVANALAIYFSERCSGEFKNNYITFSMNPQFVHFNEDSSLLDKLRIAFRHSECSNTNIEAVFDLILSTAVKSHMRQEDMPKNIVIISDMEFDGATTINRWSGNFQSQMKTVFENITAEYNAAGYKMPKLVFWNVNSRTNTIPVTENDLGVALVSGFSANIAKMVMSGKTDPWEVLKETLDSERYSLVDKALADGE